MNCAEIKTRLSPYLEKELPQDQQKQLEAHLGSCAVCRQELEIFKAMVTGLGQIPDPKAPADFASQVRARIDQPLMGVPLKIWVPALAAAVVVLVVSQTLPQKPIVAPMQAPVTAPVTPDLTAPPVTVAPTAPPPMLEEPIPAQIPTAPTLPEPIVPAPAPLPLTQRSVVLEKPVLDAAELKGPIRFENFSFPAGTHLTPSRRTKSPSAPDQPLPGELFSAPLALHNGTVLQRINSRHEIWMNLENKSQYRIRFKEVNFLIKTNQGQLQRTLMHGGNPAKGETLLGTFDYFGAPYSEDQGREIWVYGTPFQKEEPL